MKQIKIDKDTRITFEPENYILQRRIKTKPKNSKKPTTKYNWKTDGYFGDLVSLALEYINASPSKRKQAPVQSLQEVIDTIKGAEKRITKIIKKIK